jgi:hypothetical protein
MSRGGSTLNKRHKEQARQRKRQEKLERRSQRKQEKTENLPVDDAELRANAEAQAALFHIGTDEANETDESTSTMAGN